MTADASMPRSGVTDLTIGDLARRTGVNVATLRMWEERHGFPAAERLPSGHRRYAEATVDDVLRVKRRRDAGIRIASAVAELQDSRAQSPTSLFAELRRRRPDLPVVVLRKDTLLALTRALEDECCARAQRPWLVGAFQLERFYRAAEARWRELARTARRSWALAAFAHDGQPQQDGSGPGPVKVDVPRSSSLLREWSLVCVAEDLPAVLAAWELPGQDDEADMDRRFESIWSLEPDVVEEAARASAAIIADLGHDPHGLVDDLDLWAAHGRSGAGDVRFATTVFQRVLGYVDEVR